MTIATSPAGSHQLRGSPRSNAFHFGGIREASARSVVVKAVPCRLIRPWPSLRSFACDSDDRLFFRRSDIEISITKCPANFGDIDLAGTIPPAQKFGIQAGLVHNQIQMRVDGFLLIQQDQCG